MPNFNPGDMILFAKVAECGSISAAARANNRPKASVSRAVSRLEDALGVTLIERSSRFLALTEVGASFLVHCQHIAHEISMAEAAVENIKGTVSGVLRVAVPLVLGRSVLAPILPMFMTMHPDLEINIKITDRTVNPIEEGLDVIIRASPLEDSSLISRLLGGSFYGLYASPDYLARYEPLTRPADLASHNLLDYISGAESRVMKFECEGITESFEFRAHLNLNDAIIRRDAAIQGLGIGVLPNSTCKEAVESGALLPVLPGWTMDRAVRLYALWPNQRNLLPRVRVFVDFLAERVPVEMGNVSE